jgi:hypothetical protein
MIVPTKIIKVHSIKNGYIVKAVSSVEKALKSFLRECRAVSSPSKGEKALKSFLMECSVVSSPSKVKKLCWGEGEDATLRSSLRLSRCTNGSRTTGEVHPSSSTLQDKGLR